MLYYIEFIIKYGSYGLITILCFVIYLLAKWILNNHIEALKESIKKIDLKITGIGKSLDDEKVKRELKDEEQGKELVAIGKDIEYMTKDIKRIDDKYSRYFNGRTS
jgi:hypothetical protein